MLNIDYKTNIERSIEREDASKRKIVFELNPVSNVELCIKDIYDQVIEADDIETFNSLQMYLGARNLRHDLWVDFLANSVKLEGVKVGDIKVCDYLDKLDFEGLQEEDKKIMNKTPDIFPYIKNYDFFILGDVAVTTVYDQVKRDKYIKYKNVKDYLTDKGYKVKWLSFILKSDLSNLKNEIDKFNVFNFFDYDVKLLEKTKIYFETCNTIMDECRNKVTDLRLFNKELNKTDSKSGPFDKDAFLYDSNRDLNFCNKYTEHELIDMIKNECDRVHDNKYFDNSVMDSVNSFNDLKDTYADKEYMPPKSTIKVVDNSSDIEDLNDHKLLIDYIEDISSNLENEGILRDYILNLLPSKKQIRIMSNFNNERKEECREEKVYGKYQYLRYNTSNNNLSSNLNYNLLKGKKLINEKTSPKMVNPMLFDECIMHMDSAIRYYGSKSQKPSFLDMSWDTSTSFEYDVTAMEREIYNYVKSTNGAQLGHSLSNLYQRITHLKTSLSKYDNIYTPPNGSFVAVIPKEHAPVSSKRCDLPFIFITRVKRGSELAHVEYEHKISGSHHDYYISKLCRMDIDKIKNWNQCGYKIVSCSTYLITSCPILKNCIEDTKGLLTLLTIDSHQKISEYLDLLKYIAYMPFADISRLSTLIKDKMDLLIKTRFDVWMAEKMKTFIVELSQQHKLKSSKPIIRLCNSKMTNDSLVINISLPSFIDTKYRHIKIEDFIEEMTMLNTIRPKHLYGSQFMDRSLTMTAEWNNDYQKELDEHGNWASDGYGNGVFPFDSKFCFSADAIIYANKYYDDEVNFSKEKIEKKLTYTKYNTYMHHNCSLRGCTNEPEDRANSNDLHTTSIESCLKIYKKNQYIEGDCTTIGMANHFINSNKIMQFSMSEKDQRGGGRPIATPTIYTKAALMVIEKPEQAIGTYAPNNIIVEGKNKLKEITETYKNFMSLATRRGFKYSYQLTEDQSKFSENDNTRKFVPYILSNPYLSPIIKRLQIDALAKLIGREHLVHRIPKFITENNELYKHLNKDHNGVVSNIGWPQGMLNFISKLEIKSLYTHFLLRNLYGFWGN